MAATLTTEERELKLVDQVDFRILDVANNEQALKQLLQVYLVPLLLKAGSPHQAVRNKVGYSSIMLVTVCNWCSAGSDTYMSLSALGR